MNAPSAVKTWKKTSRQNLVRHKSGGYYARLFLNGKEIWTSLRTNSFSIAQAKLAACVIKVNTGEGKQSFAMVWGLR